MNRPRLSFYEFFAGGGMARAGLGPAWSCAFANDFDSAKAGAYRANWSGEDLVEGDVWALSGADLPGRADLAWASSPCQDLSLAGARSGLGGRRSSAFWGFWRLIEQLEGEGRAPKVVVIENVSGLLTSGNGADFAALCATLAAQGYVFGALEIDAARFLPQSRPRLFVVASKTAAAGLQGESPFHTRAVRAAHAALPDKLKAGWRWWSLPAPLLRNTRLADLLEPDGSARWNPEAATRRAVELMSPLHRRRVKELAASGQCHVGALFKRMRKEDGRSVQRAEVRFDGLAGCLRTPRGGSSRQTVIIIQDGKVRSRLLTAREGARLMGLPEDYRLPASQSAGLRVVGDGVAVPVVRWLAAHLLEPLLGANSVGLAAE
jgi:DNA (cytosine-5)-methyltransferase 1